jgi:hypothetical protein
MDCDENPLLQIYVDAQAQIAQFESGQFQIVELTKGSTPGCDCTREHVALLRSLLVALQPYIESPARPRTTAQA